MATTIGLGFPGPTELDSTISENEVDYRQGSSDDEDQNSSDVQDELDMEQVHTPNPEGLPLADSSLYYRIPPNTAGLNPTTESKYACSLLEDRSCLATFHKTWQLQDHFAHVHRMYVPPPRRGNPKRALKPRSRSKPKEDNLLKQKLRNGGDFELKWWRKKTSRMKAFIVKVLTKWHVDGVQSENNPNLKSVTNPPSLARLLIRYPQTALPIPIDSRPLDKQIVDEKRWAMWELALESFLSSNEGRIALNNVVERSRMDLDQIEEEEEREQVRRACSLLEFAFPLILTSPPNSASSHEGGAPWRLGIQPDLRAGTRTSPLTDPIAVGGIGSTGNLSVEPLQDAHRLNIVNAALEWMGRWRKYLLAVGSRVDKDKWVGEKSIEMYRTWRRGKLPMEDYETCKMLSWRFWTPARQKNYPEQFSEALRGFPDSHDLCSSEEEPPLELEDFLSQKVGTNNLPKFDHKQYLKRRKAKKAAREARREAGEDVAEPQRPRPLDGDPEHQTSFNYNTSLPWIGDSEQRRDIGYVSSEGNKSAQLADFGARRREFSSYGRKRKHVSNRSMMGIDDHQVVGNQQTVTDPNQRSLRRPLTAFGQSPRIAAPPLLIPGGMTAEQVALLERLQEMRNTELKMIHEQEEQELQQRATGFDEMRRDLRRLDADREHYLTKEKQHWKKAPNIRRERKKGETGLGESIDSDTGRNPRDPDFL